MEVVKEKVAFSELRKVCMHQVAVDARLLAAAGVSIAKVLSVTATCSTVLGEVFTQEARYTGKVNFKVLYTCTEGKNHAMDYSTDFTDKLVCPEIRAGLRPMLISNIIDTSITSADEGQIKLTSVVETAAFAAIEQSVESLAAVEDSVFTEEREVEALSISTEKSVEFSVLGSASLKSDKLLLSEARVVLSSSRASFDSIIVEGEVLCTLVGEDGDLLYSVEASVPFSEELAAGDVREEHFVVASLYVSKQSVTVESDGAASSATLEFNISASLKAFRKESVKVISDVFSVTYELEKSVQDFSLEKPKLCTRVVEGVEGNISLDIAEPLADQILAVVGRKAIISNVAAGLGSVTLEGILSASVIYYSAEGNLKNSVEVEIPFSIVKEAEGIALGDSIIAKAVVADIITKIARGSEIAVKASLDISLVVCSKRNVSVLTDVVLGEERAVSNAAFSVHIGRKGETLWDIAKALGLSPDTVTAQNSELVLPLEENGCRIVGYRQLVNS